MQVIGLVFTRTVFRDEKKLQFCVQVFISDIELQELTHAGGKTWLLYCDMTEAELQNAFEKEDRTFQSLFLLPWKPITPNRF